MHPKHRLQLHSGHAKHLLNIQPLPRQQPIHSLLEAQQPLKTLKLLLVLLDPVRALQPPQGPLDAVEVSGFLLNIILRYYSTCVTNYYDYLIIEYFFNISFISGKPIGFV